MTTIVLRETAEAAWDEQERRADGDARLTLSHAHRSPPPATPCHPSTDARVTDYRWQS